MNRAQRRRQGKAKAHEPVINLKKSDIEKIKEQAVDDAMVLLLSIPVKVMREKFGWGAKRLPILADALIDEYQSFSDGEYTLEEYQELVFQYTGVKFQKNKED